MTKTASSIIYQQLELPEFKDQLREIHQNFPNVKIERHIANALVTSINNAKKKFTAYSEVKKVDICLYENELGKDSVPVKVELKYHFAPDFLYRLKGVSSEVLKDIEDKSCDIFIHVIADRHGANEAEWKKCERPSHRLNGRGIPIAYLNDQIAIEKKTNACELWTGPLITVWKNSWGHGFNYLQRKTIHVHKGCDKAPPLWLHFVILSKEGESISDFSDKELKDFFEDLSHWN